MRIVHFSDWHGVYKKLPEADLYICTGDMLPNDPIVSFEDFSTGNRTNWNRLSGEPVPFGRPVSRKIDKEHEKEFQTQWIEDFIQSDENFDELLESPSSPVLCVRGNHDFSEDYWRLFSSSRLGLRPVIEIRGAGSLQEIGHLECCPTKIFDDIKVAGFRGISRIWGEWNDELTPEEQYDIVAKLPKDGAQLIVSHTPPYGILDSHFSEKIGIQALRTYTDRLLMENKRFLHCFGHDHEDGCLTKVIGEPLQAMFSNAATHYNVIDWDF